MWDYLKNLFMRLKPVNRRALHSSPKLTDSAVSTADTEGVRLRSVPEQIQHYRQTIAACRSDLPRLSGRLGVDDILAACSTHAPDEATAVLARFKVLADILDQARKALLSAEARARPAMPIDWRDTGFPETLEERVPEMNRLIRGEARRTVREGAIRIASTSAAQLSGKYPVIEALPLSVCESLVRSRRLIEGQ